MPLDALRWPWILRAMLRQVLQLSDSTQPHSSRVRDERVVEWMTDENSMNLPTVE